MHEVVAGTVVGMVHPGEMGASVAGALVAQGVRVIWASEGRSEHSHRRAQAAGLEDAAPSADDQVRAVLLPRAVVSIRTLFGAAGARARLASVATLSRAT